MAFKYYAAVGGLAVIKMIQGVFTQGSRTPEAVFQGTVIPDFAVDLGSLQPQIAPVESSGGVFNKVVHVLLAAGGDIGAVACPKRFC